jgi:hypothetical protein
MFHIYTQVTTFSHIARGGVRVFPHAGPPEDGVADNVSQVLVVKVEREEERGADDPPIDVLLRVGEHATCFACADHEVSKEIY